MKRLSFASRGNKAFTLVELMVASSVTALLLGSICGIYFVISAEWDHQQGQASALTATSQACSRMHELISQAAGAYALDRFSTGDVLVINMPSDKANNIYVPFWGASKLQYRSGALKVFYTSDSTGSINRQGDILWLGDIVIAGSSYTVTPDKEWSLYYNSKRGRTAPIKSLRFTVTSPSDYDRVTFTVASTYKLKTTQKQLSQTGTVCLRNSD